MDIKVTEDYLTINKLKVGIAGIYYVGIEFDENVPRLMNVVVKSVYGRAAVFTSKDKKELKNVYKEISTKLTSKLNNFADFITHTVNLDKVDSTELTVHDTNKAVLNVNYPEGTIAFRVGTRDKAKKITDKIKLYELSKKSRNASTNL